MTNTVPNDDNTEQQGSGEPVLSPFAVAMQAEADKEKGNYPMPASQPMLMKGVRWGIIATVTLMIVFGVLGYLLRGTEGLYGGLIGAAIGGLLLLVTVGSIAFGNKFVNSELYLTLFFAIVMGAFVLKLIAFVVAAVLLRDQAWLDSQWLFIGLVSTILVSIMIDVWIVSKSRVPYVNTSTQS